MNNLRLPDIVRRFKVYASRPENSVWGSLHIVLSDGNVSDGHVRFCKNFALENNDTEGAVLADLLLQMSKTQRKKLPYLVQESED